jgi:hypothetical protein
MLQRTIAVALVVGLAAAAPASAQVIAEKPAAPFPDPARFSRGLFVEGDAGAILFAGRLDRYLAPGPALSLRVGYDLLRWLALQGHVDGAIAAAKTPAPLDHQSLELFRYAVEARAQLQLRRVGLYLTAGGGLAQLSTNLLASTGVTSGHQLSAVVAGGAGIDLHTLNRHFSVGLAGDYTWFAQWQSSHAVTVEAYLRYTR